MERQAFRLYLSQCIGNSILLLAIYFFCCKCAYITNQPGILFQKVELRHFCSHYFLTSCQKSKNKSELCVTNEQTDGRTSRRAGLITQDVLRGLISLIRHTQKKKIYFTCPNYSRTQIVHTPKISRTTKRLKISILTDNCHMHKGTKIDHIKFMDFLTPNNSSQKSALRLHASVPFKLVKADVVAKYRSNSRFYM